MLGLPLLRENVGKALLVLSRRKVISVTPYPFSRVYQLYTALLSMETVRPDSTEQDSGIIV